jgi:arylsulfatase A-like enzyme
MHARRAFGIAATLGLCAGLVEGAALLSLQQAELLGWRIARVPVWTEIVIISPLVTAAVFLAVAACVIAIVPATKRVAASLTADVVVLAVCSFLMWFDWLTLLGRLRVYAVVPLSLGLASVMVRWYRRDAPAAPAWVRRGLPLLVAATILVAAGTYGRTWINERTALGRLPTAAAGSPNVLIVVLDTVRADHVSSYGYSRPTTPFIDRLGTEGAVFDNAYSTSSWTLPAHGSLLTGLLPHEHGATTAKLDGTHPMLSEALLARGYRTAAFSANIDWFTRRHGFGRGFIRFGDFFQSFGDMAGRTIFGRMFDEFAAERLHVTPLRPRVLAADINRAAIQWVDGSASSAPFFLVLNYFDAHGPFEPPQPWRRKFSSVPNPGGLIREGTLRQRPHLTAAQLQGEIDAYDGGIAYLDRQVETLMGDLERRGPGNNTVVIIVSDHGEGFGEHGLFTHRDALYRELIRVPLIVHWPGHVPGHARFSTPVSIADIPATVIDLLKGSPTAGMPGRSLALAWTSPAAGPASIRYPVQELARMPFDEFNWVPAFKGAMRSVTTPAWHYIEHDTLGAELFDLERDPQELSNAIELPGNAPIARQLADYLRGKSSRRAE